MNDMMRDLPISVFTPRSPCFHEMHPIGTQGLYHSPDERLFLSLQSHHQQDRSPSLPHLQLLLHVRMLWSINCSPEALKQQQRELIKSTELILHHFKECQVSLLPQPHDTGMLEVLQELPPSHEPHLPLYPPFFLLTCSRPPDSAHAPPGPARRPENGFCG